MNLFEQIKNTPNSLSKMIVDGENRACIYPEPFKGGGDYVYWLYSRNNGCQVFFAVSNEVHDKLQENGLADVSYDFISWIESEVMYYCVENTDWEPCFRYQCDYDKIAHERDNKGRFTGCSEQGCGGSICHCEPFGEGDYTWGLADIKEFDL